MSKDNKEPSEEKKDKRTKYITFGEWETMFSLVRELSVMIFELVNKVEELEKRTLEVENLVKTEVVNLPTDTENNK